MEKYMLTINYTDGSQIKYPVATAYLVKRIIAIRDTIFGVESYKYGESELVPVAKSN